MRDKIIDKVRKLLALSNSSNEHEAALAAGHAQRLLAEYNLQMTDLEVKESGADRHDLDLGKKKPEKWVRSLAAAVAQAFDCKSITCEGGRGNAKISFVGCGEDPVVAHYTTQYLINELTRLAKQHMKSLGDIDNKPVHRRSYLLGATRGVHEQLSRQKKATPTTSTALVPVKDALIKQCMNENFPDAKAARTRRSSVVMSSYEKGKADGRDVHIAKGVSGGAGGQRTITN